MIPILLRVLPLLLGVAVGLILVSVVIRLEERREALKHLDAGTTPPPVRRSLYEHTLKRWRRS